MENTKKYDREKIKKSLIKEGFSPKEIKDVLQGIDDVENDRVFSAEEVYKELLINKKVYA